jgi:Family of unknown function (DUF5715)
MRRMKAKDTLLTLAAVVAMTVVSTTPAAAVHNRTHRRLHRVPWNPVLKGSYESQLRQNEEIDRLQLPRIADQAQLEELIRTQELVEIKESSALRVSPVIEPDKRYCRPWTNQFVQDFSQAYYKEFGVPIQVNSAVRTMEQQQKLRRHNHNAAPELGEVASSHLAGITVDLARRGLTTAQHKFMEDYMKNLRDQGLIEVAEERRQKCFHVMVSDRYTDWHEANLADKLVAE